MRFYLRSLVRANVYPRETRSGALGGVREGFSVVPISVLVSAEPVNNTLNQNANALISQPFGLRAASAMRLRMRRDAEISPGDGVSFEGETGVCWRCVNVQKYFTHIVARIERIER